MKIDCHTHIVSKQIKDEYFSKVDCFAIVMSFLDKFKEYGFPDNSYETVLSDNRLFLSPSIDLTKDIEAQLDFIEERIDKYRIVGLKIFLTYQKGRADDEKLLPVYEFAEKNNLTITYHTGSTSLVLPSDDDMEGSRAFYINKVAEKFPKVNFVIAHMDDPRFLECMEIVSSRDNLFTDFSGAYEPGTKEGEDMAWAIETFKNAINKYPNTHNKILYGTDFCPPINLSALEEYDITIEKIFSKEEFEDIYYINALRAFPKLKEYIRS